MTTPMTAWPVKSTALSIMITPTGTLVFSVARLTIHPLGGSEEEEEEREGWRKGEREEGRRERGKGLITTER